MVGADNADAAVVRLFHARYAELVGLARLLLNDPGGAEEVVQEAFVRFHRAQRRTHGPDHEAAYMRAVVCNLARTKLRRRLVERRLQPVPERDHGEAEPVVDHHERAAITSALRGLPRRQREVVVMRYWLDLSEKEIADALGIAPGSVKSQMSRGMATLTERLEGLR